MIRQPHWVEKRAVLLLHGASIARFGGCVGPRDEHLLESALALPERWYSLFECTDLAELTTLYGHGIAQGQPFADGNKRASLFVMGLFLSLNGHELRVSQATLVRVIDALADGSLGGRRLAQWMRNHIRRI